MKKKKHGKRNEIVHNRLVVRHALKPIADLKVAQSALYKENRNLYPQLTQQQLPTLIRTCTVKAEGHLAVSVRSVWVHSRVRGRS